MSCNTITITTGEDVSVLVQLQSCSGLAYTGALGGSVTASLVDTRSASTINGTAVAQADGGSANWSAGTVDVRFSSSDTAALSVGSYYMQVNVTESGGDIRKVLIEKEINVRSAT